jgi:hypothetical protein
MPFSNNSNNNISNNIFCLGIITFKKQICTGSLGLTRHITIHSRASAAPDTSPVIAIPFVVAAEG